MAYLFLFLSSLLLVSCKSFQQENVRLRKWLLIPPTSYVFAFAELLLLTGGYKVITGGSILLGALSMGTGAWIGAYSAMGIHDWME